MSDELAALTERDGEWFIGFCPEVTGENGRGLTEQECREGLSQAIKLILEDRREDR
jgi:predicted RNase H-like HicB family nuclease